MTDTERRSIPPAMATHWKHSVAASSGDRLPPRHEPLTSYRTLTLRADAESVHEIGPWVSASLAALDSPLAARVSEIELAIHELAIAIVDRALESDTSPSSDQTYTITLVKVDDGRDTIQAVFADDFAPLAGPTSPVHRDSGSGDGLNLSIVLRLASSVAYERVNDINQWTLVFCCPMARTRTSPFV